MGGKTKQAPRTKNNARPSSSGRSAELLGTTIPQFVGFTSHSDLGMIPFAPGFSTVESIPENFDSNISPECQVILRKLSKKDPITKIKALQELNALLLESDPEETKYILPLWPKLYHNLSNDIEHRVREQTQIVQSTIALKAGKAIAPFIKQLAPEWITNRFDTYSPAGSAALSSFKSSFPLHKHQEVFIFCQNEIIEYVTKNLTFHTASTLSNMKIVTPEDAESKYQRVIIGSMKTFSLFLETTVAKPSLDVDDKCKYLLQNQKFWGFAKHKVANIKSAFFELMCAVLLHAPRLIEKNKSHVMQVCFQHLDDTDPLISPHVWESVLLIQTKFIDWHEHVSYRKVIQPKLVNIFKSIECGNASSIARNFLPLLSKLSENDVKDLRLYEFYAEFFDNMKSAIQLLQSNNVGSKADTSSLISAYFECLRYVFKKNSTEAENNKTLNTVSQEYLQKYIIDITQWSLDVSSITLTKNIYKHSSALIAYWSSNSENNCYRELLSLFWSSLLSLITKSISTDNIDNIYVKNVIELIKHFYTATPALHDNKVKFGEISDYKRNKNADGAKLQCSNYVAKDLKIVVIKIVKMYMEKGMKSDPNKYSSELKTLCLMFGDANFYKSLSPDECLATTLSTFVELIKSSNTPSEDLIDVVFKIITFLEKDAKMSKLKEIVKLKNNRVQLWILQRILSYPLCIDPETKAVLEEKDVQEIVLRVAKEAVNENSTEKFNLLKKCFFQIDSGEILVNKQVVQDIINTVIEPLSIRGKENLIDTCGSFVAQIMPVICSNENSTKQFQNKVFMELFKFSFGSIANDNLSDDSLWEITTCWQDALSCKDIVLDDSQLIECRSIIENKLRSVEDLPMQQLDNISELVGKLICCFCDEADENLIEAKFHILLQFSDFEKEMLHKLNNVCKFYEALEKVVTVDNITNEFSENIQKTQVQVFYRKVYVIFSVIYRLVCGDAKFEKLQNPLPECLSFEEVVEEERENDETEESKKLLTWSSTLCELINKTLSASAIGESLMRNSSSVDDETENIVINFSEKIKFLLQISADENIKRLKEDLFGRALIEGNIIWLRTLPYLLSARCYQQYSESAPIVILEDISDSLLARKRFDIYNNLAEVFLNHLTPRSLLLNEDLLKPNDDIKFCSSILQNLLRNHMSQKNCAQMEDKQLVRSCIEFITHTGEKQSFDKERFLYNVDIQTKDFENVCAIVQFIKLLNEALQRFPTELNIKNWDSIRIGLCSWVLSVSKSVEHICDSKVALFTVAVYELFAALCKVIKHEKSKSSTELHSRIIEEWENVFSKEVNLVLFKTYYSLVQKIEKSDSSILVVLLKRIASCVAYIDYNIIYNACQSGFKLNVNDLIEFLLHNLSNFSAVSKASASILKKISEYLMKNDLEKFEKNNETMMAFERSGSDWHFLKNLEPYLEKYGQVLEEYTTEFSYKLTELPDLKRIDKNKALTYFYLWDCIVNIFAKAPAELKSLYAAWITKNKFENLLLNFIFRAMPQEILKNHDQKSLNNDVFKTNLWITKFDEGTLSVEKCACFMYTQVLRYLPVIVRKWWNSAHSRQKNFIDKLTTNFVSNLIWLEDLKAINKTDKHENIQITVHQSTREVIAVYSIDEARMELIITLPQNHPLGVIKVEMGKQIGGKASSRNIGMQLTIFLTHQNGSIFDGLLLWKKNLDKKFSGVEECYVCYTVIHQDTCQLPKLTCKTCKKKFHGPCLYKWFTTSSKSTCPLCRNVF